MKAASSNKRIQLSQKAMWICAIIIVGTSAASLAIRSDIFDSLWANFAYHVTCASIIIGLGVMLMFALRRRIPTRPNIGIAVIFLTVIVLFGIQVFWLDPFIAGLM